MVTNQFPILTIQTIYHQIISTHRNINFVNMCKSKCIPQYTPNQRVLTQNEQHETRNEKINIEKRNEGWITSKREWCTTLLHDCFRQYIKYRVNQPLHPGFISKSAGTPVFIRPRHHYCHIPTSTKMWDFYNLKSWAIFFSIRCSSGKERASSPWA